MSEAFNMLRTGLGLPKEGIVGGRQGGKAGRGSFGGLLRFVPPPLSPRRPTPTQFCNLWQQQEGSANQEGRILSSTNQVMGDAGTLWWRQLRVSKTQGQGLVGPSSCHPRKWDGIVRVQFNLENLRKLKSETMPSLEGFMLKLSSCQCQPPTQDTHLLKSGF